MVPFDLGLSGTSIATGRVECTTDLPRLFFVMASIASSITSERLILSVPLAFRLNHTTASTRDIKAMGSVTVLKSFLLIDASYRKKQKTQEKVIHNQTAFHSVLIPPIDVFRLTPVATMYPRATPHFLP